MYFHMRLRIKPESGTPGNRHGKLKRSKFERQEYGWKEVHHPQNLKPKQKEQGGIWLLRSSKGEGQTCLLWNVWGEGGARAFKKGGLRGKGRVLRGNRKSGPIEKLKKKSPGAGGKRGKVNKFGVGEKSLLEWVGKRKSG